MTPVQGQRSLHLKVKEESARAEDSSEDTQSTCPYCTAPMPVDATVCRFCRRSLPEIVVLKVKAVLCLMGLLGFLGLAAERFLRLRSGEILWLQFEPNPAKYLEWLIADPGPFILGVFIFGYALDSCRRKLGAALPENKSGREHSETRRQQMVPGQDGQRPLAR